jgi:hypothetical protein
LLQRAPQQRLGAGNDLAAAAAAAAAAAVAAVAAAAAVAAVAAAAAAAAGVLQTSQKDVLCFVEHLQAVDPQLLHGTTLKTSAADYLNCNRKAAHPIAAASS